MDKNNKTFAEYAQDARMLPQDASTPIYQYFDGTEYRGIPTVIYGDEATLVTIYYAMSRHSRLLRDGQGGYYWLQESKIGEDGKVLPKKVYRRTVMYHKKYARKDIPVKDVEFNVVGLKRRSTHLQAGVIIADVKFILPPNYENLDIWMSNYNNGEATVYAENKQTGETYAECTVGAGDNYTAKQLQQMLGLPKCYKQLHDVVREIYDENKRLYEQNKRGYAHYYGGRQAEKDFGRYPSFKNRLKQ